MEENLKTKRPYTRKAGAENKERTYTQEEIDEIVRNAVAQALSALPKQTTTQTIIKSEMVSLLFLGAIATGTTVALGKVGTFTKAGNTLTIPKETFLQAMGLPVVDELLRTRSLIVLDGLTTEERQMHNLFYNDGEILTQEAFFKIIGYSHEKVIEIFKMLCKDHKILVAKLYNSAYFEKHDNRVNVETVKELNKLSKEIEENGLFAHILEDMGKKLAQ